MRYIISESQVKSLHNVIQGMINSTLDIIREESEDWGMGEMDELDEVSSVNKIVVDRVVKISKIKVYDFKWKNSELRMDGVIAHELEEVIPYAVNGKKDAINKDGSINPQGVDYSKLVPILVKAIQELSQEVNELKSKLA